MIRQSSSALRCTDITSLRKSRTTLQGELENTNNCNCNSVTASGDGNGSWVVGHVGHGSTVHVTGSHNNNNNNNNNNNTEFI